MKRPAGFFERLQALRGQKKTRAELDAHYRNLEKLERGDLPAMIIAGFLVVLPVVLVIGLVLLGVLKLFGAL